MRTTTKLLTIVLLLAAAIAFSAFTFATPYQRNHILQTSVEDLSPEEEDMLKNLNGTWKGSFYVVVGEKKYINDKVTMNFVTKGDNPRLYLTVESCDANYLLPNKWYFEDDKIVYTFNDSPWTAIVSLSFESNKTLVGEYEQYGKKREIRFVKTSSSPIDFEGQPQFMFEDVPAAEWLNKLKEYPNYTKTAINIPYTYELGKRDKLKSILKTNALDKLVNAKKNDADKMQVLLNWVSTQFRHNGESGMPEKQDALSIMQYSKKMNGVECRGLSIILSEMLRAYGIPAKSVKCAPPDANTVYCHVVVHAYSKELKQWIMLDPTYNLVLKNEQNVYVSLPMLRKSLINGTKLIPNEGAGRNGRPFYMDFYRAYMTKNCFHFSNAVDSFSGAEGAAANCVITLIPSGYPTTYAYYRNEQPTYSAEEFWKLP